MTGLRVTRDVAKIAFKGVKADILLLARERFGEIEDSKLAGFKSIVDLERLTRMFGRILKAANWQDLLDTQ